MVQPQRYKSIASKFFVFTAALVFWVAAVILAYDLRQDAFDWPKGLLLIVIVVLVASAISRMTTRLLARPLQLLQEGIQSVEEGRLEPVEFSRTADEIELLGGSFNRMVTALADSRRELLEYQETLEDRIRQRTRELEAAMNAAVAASAAKSEFLANMSHELRTPMNGLLGMLDMTLATQLSPLQRENLETAHSCAYSLLALLNDVLDISKIEAGRMTLELFPFNVRELIADAARAHAIVAAHKRVPFRTTIADNVPRMIEADPMRLRQIIANLLSNAIKFTDAGAVELMVSATTSERAPHVTLNLTVSDTGMGIAPEKLENIFEKFTQADGSISRRFGGTGLGLTITRNLVELHGGRITVESVPGRGSTFRVTLPCETATEPEPATRVFSVRPRILVVDDNAVNRRMVTGILEKHGYETLVAANGEEAITTLVRKGADLVLMDIQMPVLDGVEVTRQIRRQERWSRLPIVAMTAHAMNGDQDACAAAGMNSYLSKPVHAVHLLHTVERLISEARTTVAVI